MKRIINILLADACMGALLFFGVFKDNEYAENIFWVTFWIFSLLAMLGMFCLLSKEGRVMIKEKRKPRTKLMASFSFMYDTVFSLCLAALGFLWSAAIWWLLQSVCNSFLNEIDNEIRNEAKDGKNDEQ